MRELIWGQHREGPNRSDTSGAHGNTDVDAGRKGGLAEAANSRQVIAVRSRNFPLMSEAATADNVAVGTPSREASVRRTHEIGYAARPHRILLAPYAAAFLATILLYLILARVAPPLAPVALMALGAQLVFAAWRLPVYLRFKLRVTDRLVSVRSAGSCARALALELADIECVSVRQSRLGDRLGYGDVRIKHSDGTCVVRGIKDPAEFRRRVRNAAFVLQQDIMDNLEACAEV